MSGLAAVPASSLATRAVAYLAGGPASSLAVARDVLGLSSGVRQVAEQCAVTLLGGDPRVARLPDGRWALLRASGESPRLAECRFAVVDVEATGGATTGRIVEIAVAVLERGGVTLVFESLVNPGVPLPPAVARLTGITDRMLAPAPPFGRIAPDVISVLAGTVFCAHNARFDWSLVATELERHTGLLLQGPRLCTLRLARRLLRQAPARSLQALAGFFGIENPARHRAGGDALTAARVLERLLGLAMERGAVTVADLGLRLADCADQRTRTPVRNPGQ